MDVQLVLPPQPQPQPQHAAGPEPHEFVATVRGCFFDSSGPGRGAQGVQGLQQDVQGGLTQQLLPPLPPVLQVSKVAAHPVQGVPRAVLT